MKDMFNKRQRFSLRKYSFGVASVLLGVSLFSNAQTAKADEAAAPTTSTSPGIATTSAGDPTSAVTVTSTAAATSTAASTEAVASTAVATSTAAVSPSTASTTATTSAETTASTAASTSSTAVSGPSVSDRTVGYAVTPTATPTTASMPRLAGYTGVAGTTTTLASGATVAANPTNANDVMPSDSELTNRSTPAVDTTVDLPSNPVIDNLAGNVVTPSLTPAGLDAAFVLNDPKKRVVEVWALQENGVDDNRYIAMDYNLEDKSYDIRVFNNAKVLQSTRTLPARGRLELNIGTNQAPATPGVTDPLQTGYAKLIFDNTAGTAVMRFLRYADQSATQQSPRVRRVFSTTQAGNIPDTYNFTGFNPAEPFDFNTVLQSATNFTVSYLDKDTNQQVAPTTEFDNAYSGDTFTTVQAGESDFLPSAQNKGYEFVNATPATSGTVLGSYWGGKGTQIVTDFSNAAGDIRVRATVVDDAGNVTYEAWDKKTGKKLYVDGYYEIQSDGSNQLVYVPKHNVNTLNGQYDPAGTGQIQFVAGTQSVPVNPTYVSRPIRPMNRRGDTDSALSSDLGVLFSYYNAYDYAVDLARNVTASTTNDERSDIWRLLRQRGNSVTQTNGYVKPISDIVYFYQRPKGDVTVEYYIEGTNTKIATDKQAANQVYVKENYDATTSTLKPTIITSGGNTYRLVVDSNGDPVLKTGSSATTGTVEKTAKTVQYQYKLVTGSVDVIHVAEDGTVLAATTAVKTDEPAGTSYTTSQGTFTGYTFSRMGTGSAAATGTVVADQTLHVIYVYKPVTPTAVKQKADITIVAVDASGNPMSVARKSGLTTTPITDGVLEASTVFQGDAGEGVQAKAIAGGFDYQALIAKYQALGYEVVPGSYTGTGSIASKGTMTEYTGNQTFDNDSSVDQHFVIKLTPVIVPVTPNDPVNPGGNVPNVPGNPTYPTPNNPSTPGVPDPTDPNTMVGTRERVVEYYVQDADGSNERKATTVDPSVTDKSNTLNFEKTGTINLVTGEVTWPTDWTAKDGTAFTNIVSPTITGYAVDKVVAGAHTGITAPGAKIVDKVIYKPTSTPTPTPTIQQADITFVAVDANGNAMTSGRDKSGAQNVPLTNGVLEMAVDPSDGNNLFEGQAGNLLGYDPTAIIKAYQKVGYKVVPGDFNGMTAYSQTGSSFDNVAGNTQHFVIKLTPIVVPYTPDKPVVPGGNVPNVPTDPNNPNPETPTYPNPDDPRTENRNNELTGSIKRTVVYYVTDADGSNKRLAVGENPALTDKVDTLNFQKSGTINLVTGETTWQNDWTAVNGTKFDNYASPAWSGYSVDKAVAGEHTGITAPGADILDEVIYTPTSTTPAAPKGSVTVEYVTEDGTPLQTRTDVQRDVAVGTNYTTRQKNFIGYTFVRMGAGSAAATGTVAAGEQHVVYVYRANPAVQRADITIVAVDENGNALTQGRKSTTTPEAITDGVLEASSTLRGETGNSIQAQALADNFNYQDLVKKYQKLGYKVVPGSYTGTGSIANKGTMTAYDGTQIFDNVPGNIQHYVIKLTPIIVPVTPEQPVTPGGNVPNVPTDPNNPTPETPTYPTPENPSNPNDPDPQVPSTMTGTANRVVKYYIVDADGSNKRPAPIADATQVLNFRKEGQINLVTGAYSYPANWTAVDGTEFATVVSPALAGYTADKATAGHFTGITAPGMDKADEVIYRPVGSVVLQEADITFVAVDANGNALATGRAKDGTQGVALTNGVLEMAVDPTDNDNLFKGQAGDLLGYDPSAIIKAYQKVGYKVVPGDFNGMTAYNQTGSAFDNVNGNVQHFVIKLTPIIVPVTPEVPVKPGEDVPNVPTDPNNPTPETPTYPTPENPSNPNDPDPQVPSTMTGKSDRVIKYFIRQADGSLTPAPIADNTYTLNYRKEGQINLVSGAYEYPANWTAVNGTDFPLVLTPALTGYTPDKVAAGYFNGITAPGMDKEDVVIFTKNPDNPVTPAVKQNADVTYIAVDAEGNRMTVGRDGVALVNGLLETSGNLQGDNGAKIDYSTEASIKKYLKQGYKLVSSDYPTDPRFDNDATVDQHFFVYLTPNIVPFEPNKPVEPGKDIPGLPEDPTYPEPKDPDAKDPNALKDTVTRTVRYYTEDKDGSNRQEVAQSEIATKTDTLYFRRTGTINVVTGDVTFTGWTLTDSTYDLATTDTTGSFADYANDKVLTGYILSKEEVDRGTSDSVAATGAHTGVVAGDADFNDKVIYIPIAKYIPKWPTGDVPNDPWSDVPYTNDPQDPGKIVPPTDPSQPPIPYVPGYTPKDPGTNTPLKPVDPTDPSKGYIPPTPNTPVDDTVIPYERNGNVIVKYVKEDGTPIKGDREDTPSSPVGTDYDTNEPGENPTRITVTENGQEKTYELIRVEGQEKGKVTPGTTTVTYVYREVPAPTPVTPKGDVVVEYRDEKGNVIKQPRVDTPESPVGTDYDTDEPGENPSTITTPDGKTYERIRVEGDKSGKVKEGRTTVVYIYREVPKTPEEPVTPPTPEKPVTPPATPEVPQKPVTPTRYTPNKPAQPTPATPVKELPQTGEDSSKAATVAGAGILGSLLVGLGLSRKKKED